MTEPTKREYRPIPEQVLEIMQRDWPNIVPLNPQTLDLDLEYSETAGIEVALNELIDYALDHGYQVKGGVDGDNENRHDITDVTVE